MSVIQQNAQNNQTDTNLMKTMQTNYKNDEV